MIRVALGELRKLRRPTLSIPTFAIISALSTFFTWWVFHSVGNGHNGQRGESISSTTLSTPVGFAYGFTIMSFFLGMAAFSIFASQTANEYTLGTLRNLLVRQPSRVKLLAGKFLAMSTFALIMNTFAAFTSFITGYLMAGQAKVNTHSWFTSAGLSHFGKSYLNIFISVIAFGTIGMAVGIILRSPISSLAIGLIWFVIVENILGGLITSTVKWLPGQNLMLVGDGGQAGSTISYSHALGLSALYLLVLIALSGTLFKRRDVAS